MGVFRAMLVMNKPIEEIEEFTGLSREEIEKLGQKRKVITSIRFKNFNKLIKNKDDETDIY